MEEDSWQVDTFSINAGGANLQFVHVGQGWVRGSPRTAVVYRGIALQFESLKETTLESVQGIC